MRIKRIGVMCGAKWYRLSDWKSYGPLRIWRSNGKTIGFQIGPIAFWDGS